LTKITFISTKTGEFDFPRWHFLAWSFQFVVLIFDDNVHEFFKIPNNIWLVKL